MNIGIQRMLSRIDDNTATTVPLFSYLEPAFQPYRPWTELTQLAIWLASVSKDTELQNTAIEAMIEAFSDGRAHPDPMADILVRLAEGGWIKLNRLGKALQEVSAVSELHQFVVCKMLDQYVARAPELPKTIHHLLQVMLELHSALQLSVPDDAIARLSEIKGKGKAAQLAHSLCACEGNRDMTRIYAQSVEGRLALVDALTKEESFE